MALWPVENCPRRCENGFCLLLWLLITFEHADILCSKQFISSKHLMLLACGVVDCNIYECCLIISEHVDLSKPPILLNSTTQLSAGSRWTFSFSNIFGLRKHIAKNSCSKLQTCEDRLKPRHLVLFFGTACFQWKTCLEHSTFKTLTPCHILLNSYMQFCSG